MPIETLIPELQGLQRLPREATRGVLQRRLERIVQAIQVRAPEVLDGGQRALARVLEAGGDLRDPHSQRPSFSLFAGPPSQQTHYLRQSRTCHSLGGPHPTSVLCGHSAVTPVDVT
jgi:hypothetical protein